MKLHLLCLIFGIFALQTLLFAQTITILDSSRTNVSFRGMGIAKDKSIWVSGSKGTIGKSNDEGKTWAWVNPKGFENRDFRDIEAFSNTTAIAMAVDSPGIIIKTVDGGQNWKVVYENHEPGIFLDDLCFANATNGICVGDPLQDGRLIVLLTENAGDSWKQLSTKQRPLVKTGEALFAASGSNTIPHPRNKKSYMLVTGGLSSNLWEVFPYEEAREPKLRPLTLMQGNASSGANAIFNARKFTMIVGGNFSEPTRSDSNLTVFVKLRKPRYVPLEGGYKSSIADNLEEYRVSCGPNGGIFHYAPFVTYPLAWKNFTRIPFHVVRTLPGSKTFWLAGPGGKIASVNFQ